MNPDVAWMVLGLGLIAVELMTGTLYLLFLGAAALAAALVAYLGYGLGAQVLVFAIVALIAVVLVQRRRAGAASVQAPALEIGQPVVFENWVDPTTRVARVRFRGTLWDATVEGACAGANGEVLYVRAVTGDRLHIAKATPT